MPSSASRPLSTSSFIYNPYPYDRQHQHNTATGCHTTSFSPSSSSTSPSLSYSSLHSSPKYHHRTMFSPPNRTTPIPLAQPVHGRQPSHFAASGSYGAGSLARSLMMGGSYGNGSLDERMKMGSWKGKFLGGDGGGHFQQPWGGIDGHDFSLAQMSTSIDSNNGSMKMAHNEADYCQNYNCCGVELSSMHDLLEHYEDVHVIILPSPMTHAHGLPEDVDSMELDSEPPSSSSDSSSSQSTHSNPNSPPLNRRQPIPASAPLQLSDVLLAPPPLGSASSFFDEDSLAADGRKKTKQALAGRAAFLTPSGGSGGVKAEDQSWSGGYNTSGSPNSASNAGSSTSIVPNAFFSASSNPSANSRDAANLINAPNHAASSLLAAAQAACATSPSASMAHISLPNSLLGPGGTTNPSLVQPSGIPAAPGNGQKTFHCPTPGCQKAYKQQNGLKYHLKVGQCNFEVRDAVENGLSEAEAEEKSRPFVCQVGGGCTKRYRQMNGLRYHYLNSGAHGAIGLALVSQGKHGHPKSLPGADPNGFTPKAAMGTAGSPLAVGGGGVSTMAGSAGGEHQQPVVPSNPLDEVLFTVGEEDVDMMME